MRRKLQKIKLWLWYVSNYNIISWKVVNWDSAMVLLGKYKMYLYEMWAYWSKFDVVWSSEGLQRNECLGLPVVGQSLEQHSLDRGWGSPTRSDDCVSSRGLGESWSHNHSWYRPGGWGLERAHRRSWTPEGLIHKRDSGSCDCVEADIPNYKTVLYKSAKNTPFAIHFISIYWYTVINNLQCLWWGWSPRLVQYRICTTWLG